MNRAARRGNVTMSRGRRPVAVALGYQRRDQARSGVEHDVGARADRSDDDLVPVRDGRGRFTGERASPAPSDPGPLTRQQRRHAARQASKKGGKP